MACVLNQKTILASRSSVNINMDLLSDFSTAALSQNSDPVLPLNAELTYMDKILGSGGFATVYLYEWKSKDRGQDRNLIAFKILLRELSDEAKERQIKREMNFIKNAKHKNVVRCFGMYKTQVHGVGLALEYCKFGNYRSFFDQIKGIDEILIKDQIWPLKLRILLQIVLAMEYLHGQGIWHLDLKGGNVLLTDDLTAKVTDFGLAHSHTLVQILTSMTTMSHRIGGGTYVYIPPEGKQSDKFDVYSFGILLWEVTTDQIPYSEENLNALTIVARVQNDPAFRPNIESIPLSCPRYLLPIMSKSWAHLPNDRPSFKDIKEMILIEQNNIDFMDEAIPCVQKVLDVWNSANCGTTQEGDDVAYSDVRSSNGLLISRSHKASWRTILKILLPVLLVIAVGTGFIAWYKSKRPACSSMPIVVHATNNCTDPVLIGNYCFYKCDKGRVIKGNPTMWCNNNETWVGEPPTCECPTCKLGADCSLRNSWTYVDSLIGNDFNGNFAGHQINCKSHKYLKDVIYLRFRAVCTDRDTGTTTECKDFKSATGSIENALAVLLRQMIAKKVYPQPCDTIIPPGC